MRSIVAVGPGASSFWKQAATVTACDTQPCEGGEAGASHTACDKVVSVGERVTVSGSVVGSSVRFSLA